MLDKIVGYYNQETIVKRLETILLRRKKEDVIGQLKKLNPEIDSYILSDLQISSTQNIHSGLTHKHVSPENYRKKRKSLAGQTSLFPLGDENKPLSLSGEEHKAFEATIIKKLTPEPQIEKLLLNAQAFLEGLYVFEI